MAWLKKILSMGLVLTLAMGVCACGDQGVSDGDGSLPVDSEAERNAGRRMRRSYEKE